MPKLSEWWRHADNTKRDRSRLRVAMIGQRGVPATFGGVERHVEEIGARLVESGHEVTVYCRSGYNSDRPDSYRGMRLRHLPTIDTKHLDAIAHSAVATGSAMRHRFDVVHYHALGPGLLSPAPRWLSPSKVVLTVHGRDDRRAKWSGGARTALAAAGWMSAHVPDATIVVSAALADEYARRYGRAAHQIPNGVIASAILPAREIVGRFDLRPGGYVLFVGRLVPEKAPDMLLRAFGRLGSELTLVIVGGSSHSDRYAAQLTELAAGQPRVRLLGYCYGSVLDELYSNAAAFVLPSTLEGLPLTLLEAAAHGVPVVASDIPPHIEVLGREGPGRRLFAAGNEDQLTDALRRALLDPVAERQAATRLRDEVLRKFSWDEAAAATEAVYHRCLREEAVPGVLEPAA